MTKVTFKNVTKKFDKLTAVNSISMEIEKGEFVVLLGPSGCGKTTLLRCTSGLEKVTSGSIFFDEREVTYLSPKDRNISMVFQNYAVWPHLKVKDNIGFPLKIKKFDEREIEERILWASEMLNITEILDKYPHQLSGGQRQRVAVARAIVIEPAVLLMDEPLSNLDALLRTKMRSELKKLQERLRVTTIYVTHDQVEAMTMGDRIAILKKGKLQQIGTSEEIYHHPANLFVAGFIGSPQMNFIKITIIKEDGILTAKTKGLNLPLPEIAKAKELNEDSYILGIRPEHLYTNKEKGKVSIKGSVYFVEALRSDTVLHIDTSFGKLVSKIPGDFKIKEGENIELFINPEDIHLFDIKSERAII